MRDQIQAFYLYGGNPKETKKREFIDKIMIKAFRFYDLRNITKVKLILLKDSFDTYKNKV